LRSPAYSQTVRCDVRDGVELNRFVFGPIAIPLRGGVYEAVSVRELARQLRKRLALELGNGSMVARGLVRIQYAPRPAARPTHVAQSHSR
jgi:hypothetical protein